MKKIIPPWLLVAGSLMLGSCAPVVVNNQPEDSEPEYLGISLSSSLDIPPGFLPPPGECRIWNREKPAVQQQPPGSCDRLVHQVPTGAWLITRPKDDPENVQVSVYDDYQQGVVILIRMFEAATGRFISEENP